MHTYTIPVGLGLGLNLFLTWIIVSRILVKWQMKNYELNIDEVSGRKKIEI